MTLMRERAEVFIMTCSVMGESTVESLEQAFEAIRRETLEEVAQADFKEAVHTGEDLHDRVGYRDGHFNFICRHCKELIRKGEPASLVSRDNPTEGVFHCRCAKAFLKERDLRQALTDIRTHVFAELPKETSPPRNRLQIIAAICDAALADHEYTKYPITPCVAAWTDGTRCELTCDHAGNHRAGAILWGKT